MMGKSFTIKHFRICEINTRFIILAPAKASVVERFNRTLKQHMHRYFTMNKTLNVVPVLQTFVKSYNRSYHRSIQMAPDQVKEANSRQV